MRQLLRVSGAIGMGLLAHQASAAEEAATQMEPIEALCAEPNKPITSGEFRGILAFGDRHGSIAIVENCPDRVFGLDDPNVVFREFQNAEFFRFFNRQTLTDRFAAAIDIRADFVPNGSGSARYPGVLKVTQILAFHPTERRLFDFFETSRSSEQGGSITLSN